MLTLSHRASILYDNIVNALVQLIPFKDIAESCLMSVRPCPGEPQGGVVPEDSSMIFCFEVVESDSERFGAASKAWHLFHDDIQRTTLRQIHFHHNRPLEFVVVPYHHTTGFRLTEPRRRGRQHEQADQAVW